MKFHLSIPFILIVVSFASSQDLRKGGSLFARVESNGDVRIMGKIVGRFESDGDIRVNGTIMGRIEKDGDIRKKGSIVGKVEKDGDVRMNGRIVGKVEADGDVRRNGTIHRAGGGREEGTGGGNLLFRLFRIGLHMKDHRRGTLIGLTASSGRILIELPDGNSRNLTLRERARLMGFPDSFTFCGSKTAQLRQIGNSVVVPLVEILAGRLAAA